MTELPEGFYDVVEPARFSEHRLRFRNDRWARRVGLTELDDAAWTDHFARFEPLPDNLSAPLCLRYHGHQFRAYNPHLGDGRGFLFAQLLDDAGRLLDLGTKGSGQTPYSRGGDGRLTLKGGVREILATEMLEALGVYTSKTLSLVETGEALHRGDEPSPTRSSVLVRLGHSHVRFGTFERHAHEGRGDRVRILADHCIEHYYPELLDEPAPRRYASFFAAVARHTVDLTASWMVAGFVHGVLNTDNMNICGESFDYGPWRFLPRYDPMFVAAYFDHGGLYAFGRQPESVLWNLQRFAESLGAIADVEALHAMLAEHFTMWLERDVLGRFCRRLGVQPHGPDDDAVLVDAAYAAMLRTQVGYDQFFFDWHGGPASEDRARQSPEARAYEDPAFDAFRSALQAYDPTPDAVQHLRDPWFRRDRPESMLIDEVESIWSAIDEHDDWSVLHAKVEAVRDMGRVLALSPTTPGWGCPRRGGRDGRQG